MSNLIWAMVGLFIGTIFGYFLAALMVVSKISDLEYELMEANEKLAEWEQEQNESNRLEKPVMPKIAEIYSAMGYLFNGGEFPDWLNEQEIPLGAIKEYEEAKQWFDKNIKSNFTA